MQPHHTNSGDAGLQAAGPDGPDGPGGPAAAPLAARRRRPSALADERSCPHCGRTFKRTEHLERHIRTHTKEKPFVCHCGSAFTRRDLLTRHQRIKLHQKDSNIGSNSRPEPPLSAGLTEQHLPQSPSQSLQPQFHSHSHPLHQPQPHPHHSHPTNADDIDMTANFISPNTDLHPWPPFVPFPHGAANHHQDGHDVGALHYQTLPSPQFFDGSHHDGPNPGLDSHVDPSADFMGTVGQAPEWSTTFFQGHDNDDLLDPALRDVDPEAPVSQAGAGP